MYTGDSWVHNVIMWNGANGGSIGTGHGRINPGDQAKPGDWAVGEWIAIQDVIGAECAKSCTNQPLISDFPCSFPITSISDYHGVHEDGKYFIFDSAIAECALGSSIPFGGIFTIFYTGYNSFRKVILWTRDEENIGSGRIEDMSYISTNDWQIGERIAFLGTPGCLCTTQLR